MEIIKDILFLFCFALGAGTYLFLPLVNTQLTGVGFLKLVCAITLGALLITLGLEFSESSKIGAVLTLSIMSLVAIQHFIHEDKKSSLMWGLYFLSVVLIFGKLFWHFGEFPTSFLFISSVVLFLGLSNYLMVLGHYYLVVPKLTTRPLIIGNFIFFILLGLKVSFAIFGYLKYQAFFESGTSLGMGYIFNQIILWMRILWGFLAVGAMNYMAYRCSKINSTQSATGILYIMLFFTIVGELMSLYFWRGMGVLGL